MLKHLRLEIDEQLHRDLKIYAVGNGKKMTEVAIEALKKFLSENKDK